MIAAAQSIEDLSLNISEEIHVKAPMAVTFAALLEELGPAFQNLEGQAMMTKIEPWPGGRWYRDLGDGNGHFWGVVQAIKKPTLLEITGPLMMSFAVVNNVQYRLSEAPGGTLIKFHHKAFGQVQPEHRDGMPKGWMMIMERVRARAEAGGKK
ncbi:MAG TPA: SRPBCC domain-containing protein [Candidatus Acidoferrales bacterium]|nr:SRPBCC domain-containing protein [Candidatus Acidoferrales bacterium]